MQPGLTRGVGGAAAAREVQALLNRVSSATVSKAAARLTELMTEGEADCAALARALVRCGATFLPQVYAALAAELCARLRACEDGAAAAAAVSSAWCDALSDALREMLAPRLAGSGSSGVDDLAAACASAQPLPDTPAPADAPSPLPPALLAAGRADAASAVLSALVAVAAAGSVNAAVHPPSEAAAALCRTVSRLGPALAAGPAAVDAAAALDALLQPFEQLPCGAGAGACADARRAARASTAGAAAAALPLPPCAVCGALRARAGGWAAREGGCLRDEEESTGTGELTQDTLQLTELRAAVAALPWRQQWREVRVAGRPLRLAQRPRDVRPRKGGAGETGLVLWGAALLLTWHIEHDPALRASMARGARVLELGCGMGLCSAAAALLGAHCTATDGDDEVVQLAADNAASILADAAAEPPLDATAPPLGSVVARRLRWGDAADAAALAPPYDVLLASDVVYFTEANDALLATLVAVADASPGCQVLLSHTWRKPDAEGAFFARLTGAEGRFCCEDVTPAEGASGAPPRPHGTRLLRLWRPTDTAAPADVCVVEQCV